MPATNGPKNSNESAPPPPNAPGAARSDADAIVRLVELRNACMARLNEIAAKAYQQSNQASSDLIRAINEAQFNVQVTQQNRFVDYMAAVQSAAARAADPAGLNDIAAQCAKDLDTAHASARKSIDSAQLSIAGGLKDNNDAANRDWDDACVAFVRGLNDEVAKGLAGKLNPAALAAVGQSFIWVASHLRGD